MRFFALIAVLLFSSAAFAAPLVQERSSGDLYFKNNHCRAKASHDPCYCHLHVNYLSLTGMEEKEAEGTINESMSPENDVRSYCVLGSAKPEDFTKITEEQLGKKRSYDYRSHQEISAMNDEVISVIEYSTFESPGKPPINGVAAELFDAHTGDVIKDYAILDHGKTAAINLAIRRELAALPVDKVFQQLLESRTPMFITAEGECIDCTYVLRKEGLYVMFQQGETGPATAGFIEAKIPDEFIAENKIKRALGK